MAFRPRPGGYHNREENETPAPKPKRVINAPVEKIREVIAEIQKEDPTFVPSANNIGLIFTWLQDNDEDFTLESVRGAIKILGYRNVIERVPPPAPPPPPPPVVEPEPEEVLLPGQLSLKCDKWDLEHASKEQVTDWLKRARAAGMR